MKRVFLAAAAAMLSLLAAPVAMAQGHGGNRGGHEAPRHGSGHGSYSSYGSYGYGNYDRHQQSWNVPRYDGHAYRDNYRRDRHERRGHDRPRRHHR